MINPSGVRLLVAAWVLSACFPYGFAGGGLPAHINTVAVLPFDNDTPVSVLTRELHDVMSKTVESRLGLRAAAESRADAVVRGRIVRYDSDIPAAYSADPRQTTTTRRRLQLTIDVEIVDQTNGKTLWARRGLSAQGEYGEASESDGRKQAVEKIVDDIIAGAQSQW